MGGNQAQTHRRKGPLLKRIARFAILAAVVLLAFLAYQKLFPSDEKKIRKLLDSVAETVSFDAKEGNLSKVAAMTKFGGYFSADAVLTLHTPGGGVQEIRGRDELVELAKAVRWKLTSANVEFLDVTVAVDPSEESATSSLTAKATIAGEKDFFVQELKFSFKKLDGEWRITQVETVRVFRQ